MEKLLEVIDIDTGAVGRVEVPASKFGLIRRVYRNAETKALDQVHGPLLSKENPFTPLPRGSSFSGGDAMLKPFARLANYTGFYFGIERSVIHPSIHADFMQCQQEKVVKVQPYQERELVFPVEFR